jgi:hypothetical protein
MTIILLELWAAPGDKTALLLKARYFYPGIVHTYDATYQPCKYDCSSDHAELQSLISALEP